MHACVLCLYVQYSFMCNYDVNPASARHVVFTAIGGIWVCSIGVKVLNQDKKGYHIVSNESE